MFTLPVVSFYIAMYIFSDRRNPENYAGGVAIFVTNFIVAGYCYSAFAEEDEEGPRKGARKERTD